MDKIGEEEADSPEDTLFEHQEMLSEDNVSDNDGEADDLKKAESGEDVPPEGQAAFDSQ